MVERPAATPQDDESEYLQSYDDWFAIDRDAELAKAEREAADRLGALGQKYLGEVTKRISLRREVEQRWLRSRRQYNGVYEPEQLKALNSRKYGSRAFVPLTSRVVNIVEARFADLMFSTEDRSFVITNSPQPELVRAGALAQKLPPDTQLSMPQPAPQPMASTFEGQAPMTAPAAQLPPKRVMQANDVALAVREVIEEAKAKADAMQRTVDDQLKEADYHAKARLAIHDALVVGTGVLKGPAVLNRTKKVWTVDAEGKATLQVKHDSTPTVEYVSHWHFFPDMSVNDMAQSSENYQRHLMDKYQLWKLKEQPGFLGAVIDEILSVDPPQLTEAVIAELREASGTQNVIDNKYTIFERHGVCSAEDLMLCGCLDVLNEDGSPQQNLQEYYSAVVFFDDHGRIIKANINPMDTDSQPFSVLNWRRDTASVFGFGLADDLNDLQVGANSTFRAIQDNTGLTVGPQIVVNDKAIIPADGSWNVTPLKVWKITKENLDVRQLFGLFNIDSHLEQLMGLFRLIKELCDEVAGPQFAMGSPDEAKAFNSATAVTAALGSSNVWMRRGVKLYDDQVTGTLIQRFVDWNMQWNPDPKIKGDFNVIARGVSGLLSAEGQINKITQLMMMSMKAGIPLHKMILQLREMARAMRLDPDVVLPTEAEAEELQANASKQITPEVMRLQIHKQELIDRDKNRAWEDERDLRNMKLRIAELASREQTTIEEAQRKYMVDLAQIESTLRDRAAQREADREARIDENQRFNSEMVIKQRLGSGI